MPTIPLADGTLCYEEHGRGPPLVCLHGAWQNSTSWQSQVDRFANEYHVITMDLRGHGRTGATDAQRYSIDLFTDDLERVLTHLNLDRPILCGISLGGMIIQSYLDRHPDRARAAVIGGPLQSMPPIDIPPALKPVLSPLPAITWMVWSIGPSMTFRSLLGVIRAATGRPWLTIDPSVRSQAMAALTEIAPNEYRMIFRALYEFVSPDVSHVQTPTLVLFGDHESPLVKHQGKRLADSVVQGSWQEIPRAGHLVNQDNPQAFNDACAALFDRIAVRDGQRSGA